MSASREPAAHAVCATCDYYEPANREARPGACHRFPSTENKLRSDWCGEHSDVALERATTPGGK